MTTCRVYALEVALQYNQVLDNLAFASAILAHKKKVKEALTDARLNVSKADEVLRRLQGEENALKRKSYEEYTGAKIDFIFLKRAINYLMRLDTHELSLLGKGIDQKFSEALMGLDFLLYSGRMA